ncbi:MAG: DUF4387 family protein [Burkholderiaceae bacterium]|nr:DUF4387 family protein [Burkholderiaceae bacterium]MDO9088520.1 DUF4387 family protein [Burkholderiaceae bacterium]MDP1968710.1 DUF4387 family protein [Burkholderiaceae bacterium]
MLLKDMAPGIKCRNAGASWLSIDIPFDTEAYYRRAIASKVINPDLIAKIYGVRTEDVRIYEYDPAQALKVTIPRATFSGGIDESDFDGAQQFAPLLDLEI